MTQKLSITGESIVREDGSEVIPVVYRDSNGEVVDKAYVPPDHNPEVPDAVDESMSFPVEDNTDIGNKLSESPANLPDHVPHDPAETGMEKIKNVVPDQAYRNGT